MIDSIGNRPIGNGRTFFIAEACSNIVPYMKNDADMESFIESVSYTRTEAIKIQLFYSKNFPEAERESKKRVEFPRDKFCVFVQYARKKGLLVGASVFDDEAVDLCVECQVDFLKLATRERHNIPLLEKCLMAQLPIVSSYDISLHFAHDALGGVINMACVPEYPSLMPHIPPSLNNQGWSSHTLNWKDVLIAVSRGACIVEKHIKCRHDDYEAGWSLWSQEFGRMIDDVREVERMIA